MAGTKEGGLKAAAINKQRHGEDFYAKIGAIGGRKSNTGGFAANRELARTAGAKGGRVSKRRKKELSQEIGKGYRLLCFKETEKRIVTRGR